MRARVRALAALAVALGTYGSPAFAQLAAPQDEAAHEAAHEGGGAHGDARDLDAMPNFRRAAVPANSSEENSAIPAGTVRVRVVDPQGNPVEGAQVQLRMLREGESAGSRDARSAADGLVQFEGLRTGMGLAYRAFTEVDGARYSAPPFIMSTTAGEEVRLVRFPVEHDPRGVLLSDVRTEITFQEDRLVVVVRASLVNFTNMSLDGREPRPVAFVPRDGVRFRLPEGYSAFRADEQRAMGDQRVTEEQGFAVLRGSFAPSAGGEAFEAAFQFRVKLEGRSEIPMVIGLPGMPVLRAVVATQAPTGMTLQVDGMGAPQERQHNGQRVLITGAQRQSREDAEINRISIRLRGIPASAGTSRTVAAVSAAAIVLLSLATALSRLRAGRGAAAKKRDAETTRELRGDRERLLEALRELGEARRSGEVGPETFARQRRAIVEELALVLRALEAA